MEKNYLTKHRIPDAVDETTLARNKRQKSGENNENLAIESTSKRQKTHFFDSKIVKRKPSPESEILLEEMGLGVLDTDDSNSIQSTISSTISNLVPSAPASMAMSNEQTLQEILNSQEIFSESDSNIENEDQHLKNLESPIDPNLYCDSILSDSTMNEVTLSGNQAKSSQQSLQDFTPANLVPFSRTNFCGIATMASGGALSTDSRNSSLSQPQQPSLQSEGRAIRNTSLKKYAKNDSGSAQKYKGRSPLANVTCNSSSNINNNCSIYNSDAKKTSQIGAVTDNFFMYQKNDPRCYSGEDLFSRLSDEMILSVLKWLPKKTLIRCSLVNQRFNRVAQDESLWTRLDLASKTLQPFALGRILRRGVVILRLAQCKISEPIFKPTEIHRDFMTKIQFLDLSMATITPNALIELFSRCKELRKLSLEHVPINDGVCKEIANNKHLEVLNLAMSHGITRYGAKKLSGSLKNLNTLNISWTSLETDAIMELANHSNEKLLRLNISGCRKKMTDEILDKIIKNYPNLRELDLSDCTTLTSRTIDIVAKLKHLEYLSLSRCYNINAATFLEMNKLSSVAFLDIFGVLSEPALNLLRNSFPEVGFNKFIHSAVARPTVGSRRTSIWGLRTRD